VKILQATRSLLGGSWVKAALSRHAAANSTMTPTPPVLLAQNLNVDCYSLLYQLIMITIQLLGSMTFPW
jgi:hypothetical protein